MTEQKSNLPEPDRYSVEYVELTANSKEELVTSLQKSVNGGSRQSWRLIGVAPDPAGGGMIAIWDMEGMISG
ncbi:MAG: hypothetical protein WA982_04975 [Rubrobacteraceae bacterium]